MSLLSRLNYHISRSVLNIQSASLKATACWASRQLAGSQNTTRSTQPFSIFKGYCSTAAVEEVPTIEVNHIRNVAVIAHVDHGKTTLVDQLLKQSGHQLTMERAMDSIDLEIERGITIMSKNTSIQWEDKLFNIVDTPGHQDFGGEVERVLGAVDGVLLVVDATEGPMPQTKFVISKALAQGLKPIVVINKVDRSTARLNGEVEDELFELFCNLNATDDQINFPVIYTSAKEGWCVKDLKDDRVNINVLYEAIRDHIPAPKVQDTPLFKMLVNNIEYDNFVGRIITGKIHSGKAMVGDKVIALTRMGDKAMEGKIFKLYRRRGLNREEIPVAEAGDIVSIAGIPANVTDTVCTAENATAIPSIPIDPPTIAMTFSVNDSPLQGKDGGTKLTSNQIKERLHKECENNITIQIKPAADSDGYEVHGRGELQLGILIEKMRRESYEMTISPPRVLERENENGVLEEPWEEVTIDLPAEHCGTVISLMQERGGDMVTFRQDEISARAVFHISSKKLMGIRGVIKGQTSGTAIMNSVFHVYKPVDEDAQPRKPTRGRLVSMADGVTTAYALRSSEPRGTLFIGPGKDVYKGMVIGECAKHMDLEVNPTKIKKGSNMRSAGCDEFYRLVPPKLMSLEDTITYLAEDTRHQIEVTPTEIRIRRRNLTTMKSKKK